MAAITKQVNNFIILLQCWFLAFILQPYIIISWLMPKTVQTISKRSLARKVGKRTPRCNNILVQYKFHLWPFHTRRYCFTMTYPWRIIYWDSSRWRNELTQKGGTNSAQGQIRNIDWTPPPLIGFDSVTLLLPKNLKAHRCNRNHQCYERTTLSSIVYTQVSFHFFNFFHPFFHLAHFPI